MSRPKHRQALAGTYFVTTATWERRALFKKAEWAGLVEERLWKCRDGGFYSIHRYVIMPDHLHALLTPGKTTSLERAMQLIKGGSSRELSRRFGSRFPIWQPGFTEHRIRDADDYATHVTYIDLNPV